MCEDLGLSNTSFSTSKAPVLNPLYKEHSAGGSSSGSAVLVCVELCCLNTLDFI